MNTTNLNIKSVRVGELNLRTILQSDLKRDGGDPSFLFTTLEKILKEKVWETFLDENGKPVGTLRRLIEEPVPTGCGESVERLRKLLKIEHRGENKSVKWKERMDWLRREFEKVLIEQEPLKNVGAPIGSSNASKNKINWVNNPINLKKQDTKKEKYIKRLNRDNPELYEKVMNNENSASKAAIQAGYRKRHVSIPVSNEDSVIGSVAKKLASLYDIKKLISALEKLIGQN